MPRAAAPDPRGAAEAHARLRAIRERQEEAARRNAGAGATRETAEALVQAQAQIGVLRSQLRGALDENDALRDRIDLLTGAVDPESALPLEWGLSLQESALLLALWRSGRAPLSIEGGLAALYEHEADRRSRGTVPMMVSRLRRKLSRLGVAITIETHERRGYRLSHDSIAVLEAAINGTPPTRHSRALKREAEGLGAEGASR